MTRDHYDISRFSFDEFVEFLFEHEVVPFPGNDKAQPKPWHWHTHVMFDVHAVITFYVRLFEQPAFLLTRYTKAQVEQGFWVIMSRNIECAVGEVIWNTIAPFDRRAACVRAMYHLYERFFQHEPLETSSFMWWDAFAYEWHCGNRSRVKGGEDEQMQDVIFETLERILDLPGDGCQAAALHGLGHLHHPSTEELIQRYLRRPVSKDLRKYARAAGRFEVL